MKNKTKYRIILSTLFTAALIFPVMTNALNTIDSGFQILPQGYQKINAHGACYHVYNQSGEYYIYDEETGESWIESSYPAKTFFVPTLSEEEWLAFIEFKPIEIYFIKCTTSSGSSGNSSGTDIYWHYYRDINGEKFSL